MQFKRQRAEELSVNLTPLIDVVFLLLIFFMVSTTFTKETHLQLDLPEAEGVKVETPAEQIEVVISASGQYSVNGRTLVNNQIKTLKTVLQEVSGGNSDLPITITADAKATHEIVVRAMDAAGQLGFTRQRITTAAPAKSGS